MKKKLSPNNITTINMNRDIGFWGITSRDVQRQISNKEEIKVEINSNGGSVFEANQIYNLLKDHPYKVTTVLGAVAASAAGYIFAAGDERIVHKNSVWMCHKAIAPSYGNSNDMRTTAHRLDGLDKIISNSIAEACDKKQADVLSDMEKTTYLYGGDEIVDYGLASKIIGDEEENNSINKEEIINGIEQTTENYFKNSISNAKNSAIELENFTNLLKEDITNEEISEEETIMNTEEALKQGKTEEQNRASAWLVFNDIDPDYVRKGIESGEEMNSKDYAYLNRKQMDTNYAQNLENESADDVDPEETEVETTEEENSVYNKDEQGFLNKFKPNKGGE